MLTILVGFLSSATAQPAASSSPEWIGEPKFGHCVVRQQLKAGGPELEIRRTPGSDYTGVYFRYQKGLLTTSRSLAGVSMKMEPGWSTVTKSEFGPGPRRTREVSVWIDDPAFLERFAASKSVEFAHREFGTLSTPISAPSAAIAILRDCEDRGMRSWGIDPVAWRSLRSRPVPVTPYHEWLSSEDYPPVANFYGVEADLILRVSVGADGRILDCANLSRSAHIAFVKATCRAFTRNGRFHPAIDAAGRPTETQTSFIVSFRRR